MYGLRQWIVRHYGVRARSSLAAAVVVAVAGALAAVALVAFLRQSLTQTLREQGADQAEKVATRLAEDRRGDIDHDAREIVSSSAALLQIVTASGEVIAASPSLDGQPPISSLRPAPGVAQTDRAHWTPAEDDGTSDDHDEETHVLVTARGVATPSGQVVVLVITPMTGERQAAEALIKLLLISTPLLIFITAAVTYAAAGRSLRPVEAIRQRVAGITDRDLDERVNVPTAHDELRELALTMNDMLARLQSAQQAQRRFVADASHELRSPLSTVLAGLELGQRSSDAAGAGGAGAAPGSAGGALSPQDWAILRGEAHRLAQLVDDLLLLARADERGLTPRRDDIDLDELVDAEAARIRALPGPDTRLDTRPVRVRGDRAQLVRVLRNLVDNAHRHARHHIWITLGYRDGGAVLAVADDGEGVPAEDRERVFGRFVRLDESRVRAAGGAGLGLAIVREVVTAHGGHVHIDAAAGGGALVTVWLPAEQPGS